MALDMRFAFLLLALGIACADPPPQATVADAAAMDAAAMDAAAMDAARIDAAATDAAPDAQAPEGFAQDRFNDMTRCVVDAEPGPTPLLVPSVLQTGLAGELAGVAVDVGLVDDDFMPDLLIASSGSNSEEIPGTTFAAILRGTDGGFARAEAEPIETGPGKRPYLVDVNGDRRHDLVSNEYVALATGSGELSELRSAVDERGRFAWGNVDGDDFVDLVVATQTELLIFVGGPSGLAQSPAELPHGTDLGTRHLALVHDVDGNGLGDLVAVAQGFDHDGTNPPSTIDVLLSDEGRPFSRPEPTLEFEVGVFLATLEFGDFDCDGGLDLIATDPDNGRVEVRLRTAGGWGEPQRLEVGPRDVLVVTAIATDVGDLNADGTHDLVVATTAFESGKQITQLEAFLGDGSGTLGPAIALAPLDAEDFVPNDIAVRDLDADGRDDIITTMLDSDATMAVWMSVAP